MKHTLIVLFSFYTKILLATGVPNDSLIQSVLKQHYKNNINVACTSPYEDGEVQSDFSISFKDTLTLKSEKYLFVVNTIENGSMHGHTLGCINYFFLQETSNGWKVVFDILNNEPEPIMDLVGFEIVNIGLGKKGLLSIFNSTGTIILKKSFFGTALKVNLERQPQGIYYISIINSEGLKSKNLKVIKTN